ncbi:hypothetical protein HDU84_008677 [Entophlyctis sp. JEL0112]|nr:hypothetical protein HDU84_008677 [Entophlyctis sp. JEL0112]
MFSNLLSSLAITSSLPPHPFTLHGDPVPCPDSSGWLLYKASASSTSLPASVFVFDANAPGNKDRMPLARNALRRFKTLRHPALLAFIDGAENERHVVIGTESVLPLAAAIAASPYLLDDQNFISLGLYKIAVGVSIVKVLPFILYRDRQSAIKFLNSDVSLTHGCIRLSSIYTTKSGEWRLGALDFVSNIKSDPTPVLVEWGSRIPDSYKYAPPECANGVWASITQYPPSAVDSWAFGTLIFEIFNGATSIQSRDALMDIRAIPKTLVNHYKMLLNSNPNARHQVAQVFEACCSPHGYFANDFINFVLALEQFGLKDVHEKDAFLNKLNDSIESFPSDFCKYKVLPDLIKALEFGGGGAKALPPILKISKDLSTEEFETTIVPVLVKMFGIPDRAMRVALCENLVSVIDRVSAKVLNDKIFPNLSTGFGDTNAVVRECTLRSVLLIVPKLNERIINNDLLRFLAKLQGDEEPGIRANTTICIGKLAQSLNEVTRKKVLIPAFTRSLHDPFVPARNAGLLAISATQDYYTPQETAMRLVPAIAALALDPERSIRAQAFKNLDVLIKKLERNSASMPDPQEQPGNAVVITANGGGTTATAASNEGWAGWAVGAISSTIVRAATSAASTTAAAVVSSPPAPSESSVRKSSDGNATAAAPAGLSNNGLVGNVPRTSSAASFGADSRSSFAGSEASGSLGFGTTAARPAKTGMTLKPRNAAAAAPTDWAMDDWGEKHKPPISTNTSASSMKDTNNGWDTGGWDDDSALSSKPPSNPPSQPAVVFGAPLGSSSGVGLPGTLDNLGSIADREAEKQKKREQLALLREQKKAAIAAKKKGAGDA